MLITGAAGGFGGRMAERWRRQGACLVLSDLDGDRAGRARRQARRRRPRPWPATFPTKRCRKRSSALAHGPVRPARHRDQQCRHRAELRAPAAGAVGRGTAHHRHRPDGRLLRHEAPASSHGAAEPPVRPRGAIVNVASVAGLAGAPRLSVYAAAKHGVVGLTRSAAAEYATKGIRVNAVCPSFARTAMVDRFVQDVSLSARRRRSTA